MHALNEMGVRSEQLTPPSLGYTPALDGLRAIAVILVMLTHANFQLGDNGILGVDIFFALSGFLITTLLLEENNRNHKISLAAFYTRRAFRLFPALYVILFVITLYAVFVATSSDLTKIIWEIVSSALYLSNISWKWGWGNEGLLLGHTWSLAVEEQFYLIWPCILVIALHFKALKQLAIGLTVFIILMWILKLTGNVSALGNSLIHESIFIGCLGAILRWIKPISPIPSLFILASLFFIVVLGVFPIPWYMELYKQGGRSFIAVITVLIILGVVNQQQNFIIKLLSIPFLVGVGKISYALYLWHVPVFRWIKWHSALIPWQAFALKFTLTLLLAILSWLVIEKRAVRLGHRLSKKITSKN